MGTPRLMIVVTGALALVVGTIALLALGTWVVLAIALAAHAIGTIVVVGYAVNRANQAGDKPDPVEEARIEEGRRNRGDRRRRTGQINPAKDYEVF
jgi:membrane protein implicated in regulation of membrane protease activity